MGFVSRAWEEGAHHDALVRLQVVYQDLVAQAADSLACTGEGGRFIAALAAPGNSPQIYAVGDMGPSAAHQIQIDQADEPDPIGITAYQSAAFGLEAFRAHVTGAPMQPRLVDRNYPAEAMETTPFGDQLQEPRPFQAGGLNPTVLWWTIGAGTVGCVLAAVVRPLRRPVRMVGVLTVFAVVGGGVGFGVAALRAVDPPTDPRALPAPVADERLETIAANLEKDGIHIDPLAGARMESGFEEELRDSVDSAPGPIRVAVLDSTRVDLGGRYLDADAQTIAAHMDDGVFTLVLSQPGRVSRSSNSLAIDDYLKQFDWDWTGQGVQNVVHFYADPPRRDPGPGISDTIENVEPPTDIRRLDPATAQGLDRVVLAGVPLGGALAGFGLGLGIVVAAGLVLVAVRAVAVAIEKSGASDTQVEDDPQGASDREDDSGTQGEGDSQDDSGPQGGPGIATVMILALVAGSLVHGALDSAPAVAAPEEETAGSLHERIADDGAIVVGDGAGDAHLPAVGQSVVDEVLADYEREAVDDVRLYIASYGDDAGAPVDAYELQETGLLLSVRSGLTDDRAGDDQVSVEKALGFEEESDDAEDGDDVADRSSNRLELDAVVDRAETASLLFWGNSAEVTLRLIAAHAADPDAPLPPEYALMRTGSYPLSPLQLDVTHADRDAAVAAAAHAEEAADDLVDAT